MKERTHARRVIGLCTFATTVGLGFFAAHCSDDATPGSGASSVGGADATAADANVAPPDDAASGEDASDGGAACPKGYDEFIPAASGCETKNPIGIDSAALGLWLTADRGLGCSAGRVTVWTDQSGHGRNATAIPGHRAPECGTCVALDASVPHFAAGDVDAATPVDAGKWDDDTLAVDLSFLANTAYTIIAVDRRHAPSKDYSFFIGTGVPTFDNYGAPNTDRGLHVGYRFDGMFWFDQFNNSVWTDVTGLDAGDGGGGPIRYTMAINSGAGDAGGLRVVRPDWAGAHSGDDGGSATLMPAAADGRIGRGFGNTNLDTRFRGDLAEIFIFTKALSDAQLSEAMMYVQRHWSLY